MTDWTSREGGCRCGRLRFMITQPPLLTMACHCKGCQRMTASAYSLSAAIPSQGFETIRGDPVVGGAQQSEGLEHFFCGHCMSWVFTRFPMAGDFFNVRSTMLDDTSGIEPFIETCTRDKLAWVTTPAKHSFDGFPAMEDFPKLIEEYTQR